MPEDTTKSSMLHYLLGGASLVIIIAGIWFAQKILVTLLLAVFIAAVLTPLVQWMQRKGIPTAVALVIVVAAITGLMLGVGMMVAPSVQDMNKMLGGHQVQTQLNTQVDSMLVSVRSLGIDIPLNARELMSVDFDSADYNKLVQQLLVEIGNLLKNTLLILIVVIFMLLEAALFPAKLRSVLDDPNDSLKNLRVIMDNIRRYMAIKTLTSLLTGLMVTALLWFLDVQYPLLWGLVAFMFNYVPNIGSILAAIPAVLLALLTQDVSTAVWTAIGYLAINMTISYAIEPRFMGQGLGLSTLVVFLSLVFWGSVLGPVGMLLSAPLTMVVKIVLEGFDESRWIAVLLGTRVQEK